MRVDAAGAWHLQQPGGGWVCTWPDRLDFGPGGAWLAVGGPVRARTPRARAGRRVRATLWRHRYAPDAWRRLQLAARWHALAHAEEAGLP